MGELAAGELFADFEKKFGFCPTAPTGELRRIQRGLEQHIVNRELANLRHQLANAKGGHARILFLALEEKIKAARLLGFKTEPS